MNARACVVAGFLLAMPVAAALAGPFTDIHPEEAYPDPSQAASTDPYTGFISQVQEKLRQLGFDAGVANGDFGAKTQAALGQFQLANNLPASGQLDDPTLAALDLKRDSAQQPAAEATAGSSADPAVPQTRGEEKPGG